MRAATIPGTSCLTMIGSSCAEISRGGAAETMTAVNRTTIPAEIFFTSLSQFSHRLFFGFLHHIGNFYRRSTLPFACVGRFHEGEELDGLFAFNGWTPRLEESCNLLDQRLIALIFAG